MKTVSGRVVSSKPISLSKAASTLSSFLSTDNGASQALSAYLRRASASFNELKQLHKEIRPFRADRKHQSHKFEIQTNRDVVGDFEDTEGEDVKRESRKLKVEVEDNAGRIESKELRYQDKKSEDEFGKFGVEAGAGKSDSRLRIRDENGVGYGVGDNERKSQIEASGNMVDGVELGQNMSFVIENNVLRGKERKKYEDKKDLGSEKGQVKDEGQSRRDIKEKNSMEDKDSVDGKVRVESPAKKKKKNKREQDVGERQNDVGWAVKKDLMLVLDNGGLKREVGEKRKNRDIEEEGNNGSGEQHGMKKRRR